ncbi:MAG: A/G-specific adenine glycosylase [Chloroflexota bacterium]|nr:A/G-specific adenine glycosylase [Chloroflexota bacterium]
MAGRDALATDPPSGRAVDAIRRRVLSWYARDHRNLPWRRTRDPYAVLVSEVMLQQTQANRVVDRYERFLARFPTAQALAGASDAAVLAEWSGLGYNRRALALRRAAVAISASGWPEGSADLQRLPGVGPYTARALASLAFGEAVGVVDTNVRRWLVRRFGLPLSSAPARLQRLADELALGSSQRPLDRVEVAAWTHASMELGASICRARAPLCEACPVARGCPSRGRAIHVRVPGQAPFPRSNRAARGALIRALAAAPNHELTRTQAMNQLADSFHAENAADELEREGLLHSDGDRLRLGPAESRRRAATIGA